MVLFIKKILSFDMDWKTAAAQEPSAGLHGTDQLFVCFADVAAFVNNTSGYTSDMFESFQSLWNDNSILHQSKSDFHQRFQKSLNHSNICN